MQREFSLAQRFAQAFAQLDGDGDGRVMPSELAEFLGVDLAAGAEAEGAIGKTLRGWPAEGVTLRDVASGGAVCVLLPHRHPCHPVRGVLGGS